MKRMIPNAYLEVKEGKLTAYKGIYDSEGNQIIADGGSIVEGNPNMTGQTPTALTGLKVSNGGTDSYYSVPQEIPAGFNLTSSAGMASQFQMNNGAVNLNIGYTPLDNSKAYITFTSSELTIGATEKTTIKNINLFDSSNIIDISSWRDGDEFTADQIDALAKRLLSGCFVQTSDKNYSKPFIVSWNSYSHFLLVSYDGSIDTSTGMFDELNQFIISYSEQEAKYLITFEVM